MTPQPAIQNIIAFYTQILDAKCTDIQITDADKDNLSQRLLPYFQQPIGESTSTGIWSVFYDHLTDNDTDIPNGKKDDIMYLVDTHIDVIRFSQQVIIRLKQFLSEKQVQTEIPESSYDKLLDLTIRRSEHLQNGDESQETVIREIIDDFEDMLESHNVDIPNEDKIQSENPAIIYGTDYGELTSAIEELVETLPI